MKLRDSLGLVVFLLAGAIAGCGSGGGGGQDGATEEQKKDPAWVQARLKALDQDPSIPKTAPPKK